VRRRRWIVLAAALAIATALLTSSGAGATPTQGQPPRETEIGITNDTIRIAVLADVDNPVRPGLFQGVVNGVKAFAKFINSRGGLGGRKVQVDFIDTHLSADEARNALIRACQEDFAIVGTTALFLNDVQPMTTCPDKAGTATGLPDVPLVQTEEAHQCSPVSYPVLANQLVCSTKDEHPQTYFVKSGQVVYFVKHFKNLHGAWLIPSDLRSTVNATTPLARGEQQLGIKPDNEVKISGLATQSDYTPIAQSLKDHDSTYAESISDYRSSVFLRREAKVQGVTSVKVWGCALQCYDSKFIAEGGADVDGHYTALFFIPFEEAKQNKSVAAYLKNVGGRDKADGFGAQAWTAGLFFRDVVENVVKADGKNGLTRARFLEEAAKVHDFTASVGGDAMLGPTDVGGHKVNACFVLMQVKGGKYVRVFPKQANTFDCNPKNVFTIKLDQT
jgi:ABC-type branched-subunit amino acid transport system substrate-binding protein